MRIITLGILKNAVTINGEILRLGPIKKINIHDIKVITYGRIYSGNLWVYFGIYLNNGTAKAISPYKMDRKVFLELFEDLKKINPNIEISEHINPILSKPHKIKFNFQVINKKEAAYKEGEFLLEHPTVYRLILILFLIIMVSLLFSFFNYIVIPKIDGTIDIEVYRIILIFLSGITFLSILVHMIMALISRYRGHKITIALGILTLVFAITALI